MNERERLIELINKSNVSFENFPAGNAGNKARIELADYLLENGVTVHPCKVGDILYSIWQDDDGVLQIDETEIEDVSTQKIWVNGGGFDVNSLGKSDFLSREEAEKEIAKRCKR